MIHVHNILVHNILFGRCPLIGPATYFWVKGCPRKCPGCSNGQANDPSRPGRVMSPAQVAELCLGHEGGVVFSGGEPFMQAAELASVCREIRKARPDVPILSYTGYTLEELLAAPASALNGAIDFLRQIDVLIDGPYIRERPSDDPLVGSDNQRIVALSSRISRNVIDRPRPPQLQVFFEPNGTVGIVGTGRIGVGMDQLAGKAEPFGLILEEQR